jgi:hypothetical protein
MWDFCVKDPIYFAKGISDYVNIWNCDENQYVDMYLISSGVMKKL